MAKISAFCNFKAWKFRLGKMHSGPLAGLKTAHFPARWIGMDYKRGIPCIWLSDSNSQLKALNAAP